MSDPVFLKTPEAAKRVGLATSTFEKLRCRGGGPAYLRLSPRRVVYDIAALDAWARSRLFNSTSEYSAT